MRCSLVLTLALVLFLGGVYLRPSFAQDDLEDCSDGLPSLNDFPEEAADACKDKRTLAPIVAMPDVIFTQTTRCILSVTVCGNYVCYKSGAEGEEKKEGVCKKYVDFRDALIGRTVCCDTKCEQPNPWFGSTSGCRDIQSPEITGDTDPKVKSPVVFLYICGIDVFHDVVTAEKFPAGVAAYKVRLAEFVKQRVGSKVCCDKLREAVRTKKPCDPTNDIDCDGKRNTNDFYVTKFTTFPDINNPFYTSFGAPVDDFPRGLNPDSPTFLPPREKCDCKWELISGTFSCSPDGRRPHEYQAQWLCASTGNKKSTGTKIPATEPCGRAGNTRSFFAVPDCKSTNGATYPFLESLRKERVRVFGIWNGNG